MLTLVQLAKFNSVNDKQDMIVIGYIIRMIEVKE